MNDITGNGSGVVEINGHPASHEAALDFVGEMARANANGQLADAYGERLAEAYRLLEEIAGEPLGLPSDLQARVIDFLGIVRRQFGEPVETDE